MKPDTNSSSNYVVDGHPDKVDKLILATILGLWRRVKNSKANNTHEKIKHNEANPSLVPVLKAFGVIIILRF